jgi:hypothetical protein
VPPLLANLRTSAATGSLRRNPLYLIAFLLFVIYAADKLSDYVLNKDRLGTASLGAQYVARILHAPPMNIAIESGYGEIIMEIGIVGLILWVIISFSIIFSAWRIVIRLRGSILFPIACVIFWYAFLVLVPFTFNGLNTYQNFVMNAYLWLLIGVLYRLPSMKLMAQPAKVSVQSHTRRFGAL